MSQNIPPKCLVGKDGWLFLDNDTNKIIQQITGAYDGFNAASADHWGRTIRRRAERLPVPYIFSVVPNKECVYSQCLPDGIVVSDDRPLSMIAARLPETLYPLDALIRRSCDWPVFRKTDTHWNAQGAFIFAEEIAKRAETLGIASRQVHPGDVDWEPRGKRFGDLGGKIEPKRSSDLYGIVYRTGAVQQVFYNRLKNRGGIAVFRSDHSSARAILFGDSFGIIHLAEILAWLFGEVTYVSSPSIDYDMIERVKPDLVISEYAERFLVSRHKEDASFYLAAKAKVQSGVFSQEDLENFIQHGPDPVGALSGEQYLDLCSDVDAQLSRT